MNTQLAMAMLHKKGDPVWIDMVRQLQAAVLTHTRQDEEAQLYPRLQAMLSAQENAELSALYEREFMTVRPHRNRLA